MNKNIENVSFLKNRFIRFFVAASFMSLIDFIIAITDSVIVGQYIGETGVSAISIILPFFAIDNFLTGIISLGSSYMYERRQGEYDIDGANKIFGQSIILTVFTSIIYFILALLIFDKYIDYMGVSLDVLLLVKEYWSLYKYVLPLNMVCYTLSTLVYTDGDDLIQGIANFLFVICKIVLSIFLTTLFGIKGTAIATVIGYVIYIFVLIIHFFRKSSSFHFVFYVGLEEIKEMISISMIDSVVYLCWSIVDIVLVKIIVIYFGDMYVPIATVALGILELMLVFDAVGSAMAPLAEISLGEKNIKDEKELAKIGLIISIIISFFMGEILFVYAEYIPRIFGIYTKELVDIAIITARYGALSLPLFAIIFLLTSQYVVTRKLLLANIICICSQCIFIVASCLICVKTIGIIGISVCIPIAEVLVVIIFSLVIIWIYGIDKFPWLCDEDTEEYFNYSFILSRGNLQIVIKEFIDYLDTKNIARKVGIIVSLIIEDIAKLTFDNNVDKEICAEYTLRIREKEAILILKDTAPIVNLMDMKNDNISAYIVKNISDKLATSRYHMTSSFNRYLFSIPI